MPTCLNASRRLFPSALHYLYAVVLCGLIMAPTAIAAPVDFEVLDRRVEAVRDAWQIPGMAVAVVGTDRALHVRGYGVRSANGGAVDGDTLFMIGSVSKSIAAATVATHVDSGELHWDDRIADVLPWFRLSDPWIGAEVRLDDVLSHRVGVEATDWMDDVPHLSWRESVRRLRYLPQERPFRTGLLYDNFMHSVAGLAVAELDGDYADAVARRLFEPTGMRRSLADFERVVDTRGLAACNECEIPGGGLMPGAALRDLDNVALPHVWLEGRSQLVSWRHQSSVSAGSTLSSAEDLGRYLRMLLGKGSIDGKRVLASGTVDELLRPRIFIARDNSPAMTGYEEQQRRIEALDESYALGWFEGRYAGEPIQRHSGGMLGAASEVAMLPGKGLGVVVLANQRLYRGVASSAALYDTLDRVLGLPPVDWIGYFKAVEAANAERAAAMLKPAVALKPQDSRLVGDYCHPAYGMVHVRSAAGEMRIDQGEERVGALSRVTGDGFVVRWNGPRNEPRPVTFELSSDDKPLAIVVTEVRFPRCGTAAAVAKE